MVGRLAPRRSSLSTALALSAVLFAGCLGRAHGFADWNDAWSADLSDRTGTVAAIRVMDRPGPGTELTADSPRLRNVSPTVVEVAWVGGACFDCARFNLTAGRGDELELRYDLGPPCDQPSDVAYALQIRFATAVDVGRLSAVPSWGP